MATPLYPIGRNSSRSSIFQEKCLNCSCLCDNYLPLGEVRHFHCSFQESTVGHYLVFTCRRGPCAGTCLQPWRVLLLPWAPRKESKQWTCALFQMNLVNFVHRNSSLWWIPRCWAEEEQSRITCGECPLGMQGKQGAASLEQLLWGSGGWDGMAATELGEQMPAHSPCQWAGGKNTSVRLNWGAVGLFNPANDSVSRGFDARNVVAPGRKMSGCVKTKLGWDREAGNRKPGRRKWTKLLSQKGWRGFVGNSLISETEFWKPPPSSAPKTFSVPVIFTELFVKRGCLWQQINTR